jgi:PTS system nitrogen regulatory IIA component
MAAAREESALAGARQLIGSEPFSMHLTLRQAATHLDVPEATVRRWIANRGLPVHRVNERLHCNAIELWEWAVARGIPVSQELLREAHGCCAPGEVAPLAALLAQGGIHHDVGGGSKAEVLKELVARLPLPADVDREFLLSVLAAREAMGSTGIGDGIAIPHVRNPIVMHIDHAFVMLALLRRPVEFDAIDGQPVYALFMAVSPTVPVHLRILAQLGFVLRDAALRTMLRQRAPAEDIIGRIEMLEASRTTGSFRVEPRA